MSWKAFVACAVFWLLFSVWVWTTDGVLAFRIGGPLLAIAFAVAAVIARRRRAAGRSTHDRG